MYNKCRLLVGNRHLFYYVIPTKNELGSPAGIMVVLMRFLLLCRRNDVFLCRGANPIHQPLEEVVLR